MDLPANVRNASRLREQHRVARTLQNKLSRSSRFPASGNAVAAVRAGAQCAAPRRCAL